MIDTHCHLYSNETNAQESVANAVAAGIQRIYLPAIDSTTTAKMLEVAKDYPNYCFAMMGLHPCSVKENYNEEIHHVAKLLSQMNFYAIGEIGLDFYWDKTFVEQQYIAFRKQMEFAEIHRLPAIIHSRNATAETISVLNEYKERVSGIFHCFGGSLPEAQQIIDCGYYLGIGGVITYKNSGLAEVVAQIPLKHLVLETDAPYLAPVPFRGK
ncbi:MAG: TatD family hydrolase, partial [Ferruginibacter sp.]